MANSYSITEDEQHLLNLLSGTSKMILDYFKSYPKPLISNMDGNSCVLAKGEIFGIGTPFPHAVLNAYDEDSPEMAHFMMHWFGIPAAGYVATQADIENFVADYSQPSKLMRQDWIEALTLAVKPAPSRKPG